MKVYLSLCATIAIVLPVTAQPDQKYFHQSLPDETPQVFAPGIVSLENQFEFGAVFSKDRTEFYYGVEIKGKAETRMMKYVNGKWSAPSAVLIHDTYSFNDPFLSIDEQRLYVISDRPLTGTGPKKDYDIWYVERQGPRWSQPVNAGTNINSEKNEYYISFTGNGAMYFSSNKNEGTTRNNFDIYTAAFSKGKFQPAVKLSDAINTPHYEADVFIAPDESYIIFAANRPGGQGSGDLHVSFRNAGGTWSEAKSLGNTINTNTDDFCPFVTPDGKYLMYASRGDIYWVAMSIVIGMK
jgi:Tol biopolymer transport system component